MKILRGFCNVIIGIIIFVLIFLLSFTRVSKSYLQNDLLHEALKSTLDKTDFDNNEKLRDYKNVIDKMFDDKESTSIIDMILVNYRDYSKDKVNYSVSKDDAKKLYDFIAKYKNDIKEISGENISNMTDEEFEKFFDQNEVNKFARDAFTNLDKNLDDDSIEKVLSVYTTVMSNSTRLLLIGLVLLCIIILILVNWSLVKWMLTTGIATILASSLILIIYFIIQIFKDDILKGIINVDLDINFNKYLITGLIELIIGIMLVVSYVILKRVLKKKKVKEVEVVKVVERTQYVNNNTNLESNNINQDNNINNTGINVSNQNQNDNNTNNN